MISSLGSQAFRALTPQTAVKVDSSRCVRHRCKRNECSRCIHACQAGAITWSEQGLSVDPARCTQCLRCLAVCPTAALRPPEYSLWQVLNDLAAHPDAVLGCEKNPGSTKHARFSCLGCMSHPEMLLLFALVFTEGIQFDLTHCSNCPNNHTLASIHAAHAFAERLFPDHKVRLVTEEKDLNYQPASLSRRELFGFFRERSSRTAAIMVERLQTCAKARSYGDKQVPLERTLLLRAMDALPSLKQVEIAEQVFGKITFTSQCTTCGSCVGVCPTGAIDAEENNGAKLSFDPRFCVGCGSCEAFCRKPGVRLTSKNQDAASLT